MTEKELDKLRKEAKAELFPEPIYRYRLGYGRDAAKFLGIKYNGFIGTAVEEGWPPHTDHPAMVFKNKQPYCFISQPYGLYTKQIQDILVYCKIRKLQVDINAFSVHYPGMTLMVRYWRDNAYSS